MITQEEFDVLYYYIQDSYCDRHGFITQAMTSEQWNSSEDLYPNNINIARTLSGFAIYMLTDEAATSGYVPSHLDIEELTADHFASQSDADDFFEFFFDVNGPLGSQTIYMTSPKQPG